MATEVYSGAEGVVKEGLAGSEVTIAYVTGIRFEVNSNVSGIRTLGSRKVSGQKIGNLEITGTIEKIWLDHTYLNKVRPLNDSLSLYSIVTEVTGSDGVTKTVTLSDVVFKNWSRELPELDVLNESIDFEAADISGT